MPPWRIVFSTFRDCMSFYTARVIRVGGHRSRLLAHVRIARAGSTGRCNTGVKSLCGGFESQGLTWPFVELLCSDGFASTPTSRFPSENTVSAGHWCSHCNHAVTDFADSRIKLRCRSLTKIVDHPQVPCHSPRSRSYTAHLLASLPP